MASEPIGVVGARRASRDDCPTSVGPVLYNQTAIRLTLAPAGGERATIADVPTGDMADVQPRPTGRSEFR